MQLVDTSVWIDHFRRGNPTLIALLESNEVLGHPFVLGELACGNLRQRTEILSLLEKLPQAEVASHEDALDLVKQKRLFGKGIGWVDVHLLASALLSHADLFTLDVRLGKVARRLKPLG